jgi:hypothetical protein
MPRNDSGGSGKPTKHGITDAGCNSPHRRRTLKWTDNSLDKILRQATQKNWNGHSEQYQGRGNCHENEVLHHMDGQ